MTQRMDLGEMGVIARLHVGTWSAYKKDADVKDHTNEFFEVNGDAGNWNKMLIQGDSALQSVKRKRNQAYNFHINYSLPWGDNGDRLITTTVLPEYRKTMEKFQSEFFTEVEALREAYPTLIEEARGRLGKMFKEDDYPPVNKLVSKFYFTFNFSPVATVADWRIKLRDDEKTEIIRLVEAEQNRIRLVANQHLWGRVHEAATHVVERLTGKDEKTGKDKTFRNSLVDNVKELADILSVLNIDNDPDMIQMAKRLKAKIGSVDVDEIRKDRKILLEVRQEAQNIVQEIIVKRKINLEEIQVAPVDVNGKTARRKINTA